MAATSGVSAVIAPDGRLLARTGVFTPARLVATVPLRDPRTVADRLGVWPEHALAASGLLWLAVAVLTGWPPALRGAPYSRASAARIFRSVNRRCLRET